MDVIFALANAFSPLLFLTAAALVCEYTGRTALFLEGAINLGAFLCFTFFSLTKNLILSNLFSILVCALLTFTLEKIATHFKANFFIASLAMNLIFNSLTSFLSSLIFKTRGVLSFQNLQLNPTILRGTTSTLCVIFSLMIFLFISKTKHGIIFRITGSDGNILRAQGINPDLYKTIAWILATVVATFCGCIFYMRLCAFVPSVAAGRGWTALVAVFLSKMKIKLIFVAIAIFTTAEIASTSIQNIPIFVGIPNSVLLSLPYFIALVTITIIPKKK